MIRRREPEIMDQPGLDRQRHLAALRGLSRINWFSASARILWKPLAALARLHARPLRVLDVATGGGDVAIRLCRHAQRSGVPLSIEGCDKSETALSLARQRAARHCASVRFFALDVLSDPLPPGYDVIVCSTFLHHLSEDDSVRLLTDMAQAARLAIFVNDLARSRLGWALAYVGTRLLSRSDVVHTDGPRSVAAAFTAREVLALAHRAGLDGAQVAHRWPCRFLLSWVRRQDAP